MKNVLRIPVFIAIGIFMFLVFFYFSFPYKVLKEALAVKLTEETEIPITIGDLNPIFPIGAEFTDVVMMNPGGGQLKIHELSVRLGLFALFGGKISIDIYLQDNKKGYLETSLGFPLLAVAKEQNFTPSSVYLKAERFTVGDAVNFILGRMARGAETNILVKPFLEKITVEGAISADVNLDINSDDISQSDGEAVIKLVDSVLKFHSSLQLPSQTFTSAQIKANFKNGLLSLDESSKIISDDLTFAIHGTMTQKPKIEKSVLDVKVDLEIRENLKNHLGGILDAVANHPTEGKMKIKVSGTLTPFPQIEIL